MRPTPKPKRVHCTEKDILLALREAFEAGLSSPYELKSQEVNRIYKKLAESPKPRPPKVKPSICPNCSSSNLEHMVESCGFVGPIYTTKCKDCWYRSFGSGV